MLLAQHLSFWIWNYRPVLLNNLDVMQVDAGGSGGVDHSHDSVHAHGGEQAGVLRHHFGAERGGGAVE